MNMFQLQLVIALAERKSLTETALAVHITQPSLSYQIDTIESELGFKIFDRGHSGTTVTKAGEVFCKGAEKIIEEYNEVVAKSGAIASSAGRPVIRVAATIDYANETAQIIRACSDHFSEISFSAISYTNRTSLLDAIVRGEVDLTYRTGSFPDPKKLLDFLPLKKVSDVCLMSSMHRLAKEETISIESLIGEKLWIVPRGSVSGVSDAIRDYILDNNLKIEILEYADEETVALSLLSENTLAISRSGGESSMPSGIVSRPIEWPDNDNVEGMVFRKNNGKRLQPILRYILNSEIF